MHNSGTSLLGNLMHGAGVPLGPKLLLRDTIPEERRPRYDYFEDEEVVELQDQTLLGLKRHWSSYRSSFSLPPSDHPARVHFRNELAVVVPTRFEKNSLWLIKDPRSAILVEDWLAVLDGLSIDARLLIVHRDPNSNIRSFSSKGQVPELWAEALWQRTYANALQAASRRPSNTVVTTGFEELISDPVGEVKRLCQTVGWPLTQEALQTLKERVNLNLPTQRNSSTSSENTEINRSELHPATKDLETWLKGKQHPRPMLDMLSTELERASTEQSNSLQLNSIRTEEQTLTPKVSITIVTAEFQGWGRSGGIGSAYRELACTLATAGHPIRVLLVQPGTSPKGDTLKQIEIIHLDSSGFSRLSLIRHIAEILKQQITDVIHLHDWLGLASGLKDMLGHDGPQLIIGVHGPSAWARSANPWPQTDDGGMLATEKELFDEGVVRALELDGLKQADWLISPSMALKAWTSEHLLPPKTSSQLLVNRNCPLPKRLIAQRPNQQQRIDTFDCVYFGRLEQRKGILLFLDALLKMENPPQKVLFMGGDCVVGLQPGGLEQWGTELVRKQLENTPISAEFEIDLSRDQALNKLTAMNTVVVIPSLIENSPCVVEELLDSGLRMVVTDVGGTSEMIREEDQRWLTSAEPRALAEHLERALKSTEDVHNAYRLRSAIPTWKIQLSWQSFHERLPRLNTPINPITNVETSSPQETRDPWPLWRRAIRKTGVLARQGKKTLLMFLNKN